MSNGVCIGGIVPVNSCLCCCATAVCTGMSRGMHLLSAGKLTAYLYQKLALCEKVCVSGHNAVSCARGRVTGELAS